MRGIEVESARRAAMCLIALVVASCGGDQEQDFYVEPEMPDDPTALTDAAAEDLADREELPPASPITGVDGSGATGDVILTTNGSSVTLEIAIAGLEPGEYPAHVHRGVCIEGGPVAAALESVAIESAGTGTSTSSLDAASLPPTEPFFVQIHAPTGAPVACGDLVES